jgi:hypothetical protein
MKICKEAPPSWRQGLLNICDQVDGGFQADGNAHQAVDNAGCGALLRRQAGFDTHPYFCRWRLRFFLGPPAACCFWTLAQVSRRVTMRLKTRASGRESRLSTQK